MLGEGTDRARSLEEGVHAGGESHREGRWVRPIALGLAAVFAGVAAWLVWGVGVPVAGTLLFVLGTGGGFFVAGTSRPSRD
jgi:hypothetical protein